MDADDTLFSIRVCPRGRLLLPDGRRGTSEQAQEAVASVKRGLLRALRLAQAAAERAVELLPLIEAHGNDEDRAFAAGLGGYLLELTLFATDVGLAATAPPDRGRGR